MSNIKMEEDLILENITTRNIQDARKIITRIFPVNYSERFFQNLLTLSEFAKIAFYKDTAIGTVCCKPCTENGTNFLYIMVLGCLAPYRGQGIGTALLKHVFHLCEKDKNISSIHLHVQTSNEPALDFYKKFGFEIIKTEHQYYKRMNPASAYLLRHNLSHTNSETKVMPVFNKV